MGDSVNKGNDNSNSKKPVGSGEYDKLQMLVDRLKENRSRLKVAMTELRESLDNLRLVTKYQAFDLEATKRENEDLKELFKRLENE